MAMTPSLHRQDFETDISAGISIGPAPRELVPPLILAVHLMAADEDETPPGVRF
jgi:hypothetical protein